MHILTPLNDFKVYKLNLDEFFLPSWWVYDHLDRISDFDAKFENIRRLQVSTGDNREEKHMEFGIHSIELHRKWIDDIELYSIIASAWFLYLIYLIL